MWAEYPKDWGTPWLYIVYMLLWLTHIQQLANKCSFGGLSINFVISEKKLILLHSLRKKLPLSRYIYTCIYRTECICLCLIEHDVCTCNRQMKFTPHIANPSRDWFCSELFKSTFSLIHTHTRTWLCRMEKANKIH